MANVSFPSVQQIFTTNNNSVSNSTTSFEPKKSFASVLKDSIDQVNNSQNEADNMTTKLVNGENVDLHQVMIAQQKANITLQATLEVRNKVIEAYQEMMRMQV
ncbi:flagellar hook-basal body complex protein FliE [Bacillus sp. EB600]|uniref:flagellar hook-basal body complex protein FliE n=1 Tax=Bacillus sp. EB600 TaxID=2806345 RepID=UPI00210D4F4F|nr:flagellar hook-basal body complex protein FliE [Bacillus sp. EB600]MCQ6280204.1 flagellar hook-basal body complex protein FliE [Bacillus sp. EB600]